jgi:hypothetical protein
MTIRRLIFLDRDFNFSLASGMTGMKKATLTENSARRHKDVSYRTGPFPALWHEIKEKVLLHPFTDTKKPSTLFLLNDFFNYFSQTSKNFLSLLMFSTDKNNRKNSSTVPGTGLQPSGSAQGLVLLFSRGAQRRSFHV